MAEPVIFVRASTEANFLAVWGCRVFWVMIWRVGRVELDGLGLWHGSFGGVGLRLSALGLRSLMLKALGFPSASHSSHVYALWVWEVKGLTQAHQPLRV